jgi:hypothetical protein
MIKSKIIHRRDKMKKSYQFEIFYESFLGDGWLFGKDELEG